MDENFRALAVTLVPEARGLDERGWSAFEAVIAEALEARPAALRRRFGLFLRVLGWLCIARYGRTFEALDPRRREAFLGSLERSRLLLVRRGFWGLRTLVLMGYWSRPEAAEAIGYRARPAVGGAAMIERELDVAIVGSGAGGGTVAQALAPLVRDGRRVAVFEKGPRLRDDEFTGRELEMAGALYEDGGGYLTADGTLTLALGSAYGGSTVVYTGTSLRAPERVIRAWGVPGLDHADVEERSRRYEGENHVHLLPDDEINDNNRLFVEGARRAGYAAGQFPVNVRGCKGSSLCNLGCPNAAKQGTNRVQLPRAEREGVAVVTRAEVLRVEERAIVVRVREKPSGAKGLPSEWAPGEYRVRAGIVVLAGGSVGTPALLLRSALPGLPARIGEGFTCHPAHILVAEHARELTNDVGHPKSFYVDRAAEEGFLLETCMYFPFTTAKSLVGFGEAHSRFMRAFARLQMILVLACDHVTPGNRVAIDRDGRPMVHYRFTPRVVRSLVLATRASARIFFAAGALRVHAPTADPPAIEASSAARIDELVQEKHFLPGRTSVAAAHPMGGCGMGRGGADSVTDAWGRVHGLPWLRVADASLFPDSLEINPYLTIMALADRAAEAIRADAPELAAPVRATRTA